MIFQGKAITCDIKESGIAELKFDLAGESVNKFNRLTMEELDKAVAALEKSNEVKGLLITSGKAVFIVGADVFEFIEIFKRPEGELTQYIHQAQAIFNRIEDLPYPSVAVINGVALGGGMELVLSATYRVMSTQGLLGQPEVKLGLIPGFGGTVRLTRLVGVDNANDLVASGRDVRPEQALKMGLVSAVVEPDKLEAAAMAQLKKAMASEAWKAVVEQKKSPIRLNMIERTMAYTLAKALVAQSANPRHYPAPIEGITMMEKAAGDPRDKALAKEAASFAKLAKTPVSTALIGIFHADQFLKKKSKEQSEGAREVKMAGVLGAGIMGGGVAYQSVSRGIPVVMKDINPQALEAGVGEAARLLEGQVGRGRIKREDAARALGAIQGALSYGDFAHLDVVVEAVTENPKVKAQVLADAEAAMSDGAVLASNTSTIPITSLAENLKHPENFCGMHFFNPVHRMPLVEIIRGEKTGDSAIATVVAFAKRLGKTPIVVKDGPGFLVNRILIPYMGIFQMLVMEGADIQALDKTMEQYGWPMGPAQLIDVVGLDTTTHIGEVMSKLLPHVALKNPENTPVPLLFKADHLGQKNGKGFYAWEKDSRGRPRKSFDPAVMEVLKPCLTGKGEGLVGEVVVERMMIPMVIEASRCLEQGIVETPTELDMALILGLGFPPFRGGLLRYADSIGLDNLCKAADKYSALGEVYHPTEQMKSLAAKGEGFYPPI